MRPINVGTNFSATCRPPMDWGVRWWSFDGNTARFHYDGTMRYAETLRHPERPAYTCESGDVTFSAG